MTTNTSDTSTAGEPRQVSSPNERLVLVDGDDRVVGEADKIECHLGEGRLHRAFSLHVLTSEGNILLQQRAQQKLLWPGYWSNSCCSHPRAGEAIEQAVRRRADEELGLDLEVEYLYKFHYSASYRDVGRENEICSVFIGYCDSKPRPNPTEVADCCYLTANELERSIATDPERYTPWMRMEWRRLNENFRDKLLLA